MYTRIAFGVLLGLGLADIGVIDFHLAPALAAQRAPRPRLPAPALVPTEPPYSGQSASIPSVTIAAAPTPAPSVLVDTGPPSVDAGREPVAAMPDIELELDRVETRNLDAISGLKRVIRELRENPSKHIVLRGHSDRLGSAEYNMILSRRRAEATALFMILRGAPADRITTEGAGAAEPREPGDNPVAWAKNRRVQVLWR